MLQNNTKVVIIDKDIIDNQIYTIVDSAFDYSKKELYYIIQYNTNRITVNDKQIREATQVEIDNGIKFDPVKVKTIVAFVDLLEPDFLMEVKEYNEATLEIVAYQCYSKTSYNLKLTDVRPARLNEINAGYRITVYNKELYMSYMNPFMVNDLYNIDNPEAIVYKNRLEKLGLVIDGMLTINGERLHNDIDFEYLKTNMYDLNQINPQTTYIATDKDGTVKEFHLNNNSLPMYDSLNGSWYIIETESEFIVSQNKVNGLMSVNEYPLSLKKVN